MKKTFQLVIALAVSSAGLAVVPIASAADHSHAGHGAAQAAPTAATEFADGQIKRVNKSAAKLTIKHGEIKNLQMPPMTMVFGVADKALLEGLNDGDQVKFKVKQDGSNYVVTEIKKAQ